MKTCNIEGCTYPVWSHGTCRMHTPRTPLKRHSLIKRKPVGEEEKKETEALHRKMKMFYDIHASPRCEQCGKPLPREFSTVYVHHLLPKQSYEEVKMDYRYWMILCPDCHASWEDHHTGEKIRERMEKALEYYQQTKPA